MAVDRDERTRRAAAPPRPEPEASPGEKERFKDFLAKLSPAGIRRRLDRSVSIPGWKRKLAEAAFRRGREREQAREQSAGLEAATRRGKRRYVARRVWAGLGAVIVAGMALVAISLLRLWHP